MYRGMRRLTVAMGFLITEGLLAVLRDRTEATETKEGTVERKETPIFTDQTVFSAKILVNCLLWQ